MLHLSLERKHRQTHARTRVTTLSEMLRKTMTWTFSISSYFPEDLDEGTSARVIYWRLIRRRPVRLVRFGSLHPKSNLLKQARACIVAGLARIGPLRADDVVRYDDNTARRIRNTPRARTWHTTTRRLLRRHTTKHSRTHTSAHYQYSTGRSSICLLSCFIMHIFICMHAHMQFGAVWLGAFTKLTFAQNYITFNHLYH